MSATLQSETKLYIAHQISLSNNYTIHLLSVTCSCGRLITIYTWCLPNAPIFRQLWMLFLIKLSIISIHLLVLFPNILPLIYHTAFHCALTHDPTIDTLRLIFVLKWPTFWTLLHIRPSPKSHWRTSGESTNSLMTIT